MLYIAVSARPTESFLLLCFFSVQVFGMGRSSVVVYRSLLLPSIWESVVRGEEEIIRPQSSERSVLDWEEGELLHCALCGNCNHTDRGLITLKANTSYAFFKSRPDQIKNNICLLLRLIYVYYNLGLNSNIAKGLLLKFQVVLQSYLTLVRYGNMGPYVAIINRNDGQSYGNMN